MIVVDASIIIDALGDEGPAGHRSLTTLRGEELIAPALIDLEVLSAWRRLEATDAIASAHLQRAVEDLGRLPIERAPHEPLLPRVWELRHNLTPYDAAYVALAETLDCPLLTADRRLASASGPICEFRVLES